MKTIFKTVVLGIGMLASGIIFSADTDGKAQFGSIYSTDFIVTNEVDSVFKSWLAGDFNTWTNNFNYVTDESDPIFSSWIQSPEFALTNYTIITVSSSNKDLDTEHNGKGNVMFGSNNTIMNPGPLVSGTGDDNTYNNKTRNYSGYSTVMGSGNKNSQWGAVVEGYYNSNYAGGNFKGCKFLTSKEDFISSIPNSTGGYARERYSTAWELLFTEKKLFSSVQNTFVLIEPYEMKWLFCEPDYTTMTLKCYDEYGNQFLPMNYSGSRKGTRCDVVKLVDNNDGTFNAIAMNGSDYLNNDASFSKNFSDAIWNLKINKNDRTFDYMDFWNKYNQNYSHIEGEANYNFGRMNHIEGSRNAAARNTHAIHLEGMYNAVIPSVEDPSLYAVHVSGINAVGKDMASFTWSGNTWRNYKNPYMPLEDKYHSHGVGTFNINPKDGLSGFYIGETNLATTLSQIASDAKFEAYHTIVTNQAKIAQQAINSASELKEIKDALNIFFNEINK